MPSWTKVRRKAGMRFTLEKRFKSKAGKSKSQETMLHFLRFAHPPGATNPREMKYLKRLKCMKRISRDKLRFENALRSSRNRRRLCAVDTPSHPYLWPASAFTGFAH